MAILGKIDSRDLTVTVEVQADGQGNPRQVVIVGGDFTDSATDNYVQPGDILEIEDAPGNNKIPYVVYSVTNATTLQLRRDAILGVGLAAARRTPPKEVADYVNSSGDSFVGDLLGVSLAEAQTEGARSRGITGPGWWLYKTYTSGSSGNTRHKAECIAPFKVSRYGYQLGDTPIPAGSAHVIGDDEFLNDLATAEDTVASDATSAITFGVDLADVTGVADPYTGSDITFTATSSDAAAITYQFQRRSAGSSRFVNVTNTLDGGVYGATGSGTVASGVAAALTITTAAKADLDGAEYRVKLTSATGAPEVISATATLTYA